MSENNGEESVKIDINQLSIKLGVNKMTIYSWVSKRQIPFYKIGKLVRFDKVEIEKWLLQKKIGIFQYKTLSERDLLKK